MISFDEIKLNLRSQFSYLCSKASYNLIQLELSKNIGKSIRLYIVKNDNFLKKTPTEYLHILYEEQMSKLNQALLNDPNIIKIQSLFDVKFDKLDIKIIEQ